MDTFVKVVHCFFVICSTFVHTVPPDACFEPFRFDDCGKDPVTVMYYYKPGSRCEKAVWKGCLPNENMFPDEYTCIRTCIFAERRGPNDYVELKGEILEEEDSTEEPANNTATDSDLNSTDVNVGNETVSNDTSSNTNDASSSSDPDASATPDPSATPDYSSTTDQVK
ncbi:uncharacterized protein LOC114361460 [Ostrinia furnacalis]|uniref:uncharacterized protein LOC114361460 n=1 Tax=Ostrinia furnacalis TaxID=93504 RepID=UPI00103AA20D|nr:uncharacterized protein LOC114361460 [Ostrinia furnacalis]